MSASGAIFGEVALIEDCRRNASIVAVSQRNPNAPKSQNTASSDSEEEKEGEGKSDEVKGSKVDGIPMADAAVRLVVISRSLYNTTVRAALEGQYRQKMAFVNRMPYLQRLNGRAKKQIVLGLEMQRFDYGVWLVRQGQTFDGLFYLIE